MIRELTGLLGVDTLSLHINGCEQLRLLFKTEDRDPDYLVARGEGLDRVSRDEFIAELAKYDELCMESWDYTLRGDYLQMETALNYKIDLGEEEDF